MLCSYMRCWKCCMDDSTAYVKTDASEHVLSILNLFYGNISFTYEQVINGKITFFDILVLRNGNSFESTIHCHLFTLRIICAKCMGKRPLESSCHLIHKRTIRSSD